MIRRLVHAVRDVVKLVVLPTRAVVLGVGALGAIGLASERLLRRCLRLPRRRRTRNHARREGRVPSSTPCPASAPSCAATV